MSQPDESAVFARGFIDHRAPGLHGAFNVQSRFNTALSMYQSNEVYNLQEILKRYQRQNIDFVDFDYDLLCCSWDDVLHELERAQAATHERDCKEKKLPRRALRAVVTAGDVLGPAMAAIPDELCALHGGLALVFSLARHRAQNRGKILQAFGNLPNIIQMAQDKAKNLPLSDGEPDSIRLHSTIRDLQQTLLRVLPDLIDRLNPGTLWAKATSPFRGTSIDELLEAVSKSVERVRVCAEGMMEGIIIHTHHTIRDDHEMTRDIRIITEQTGGEVEELRGKVDEILVRQKSLQLTLDAISGKNGLLDFLMEYLKPQQAVPETSPTEPSAAQDGVTPVTPSQLLSLMNVHHLLAVDDESHVIRRSNSFDKVAKGHAATIFQTPQIQQLLHAPESYVVLVDGHLDRAQISRISSLSYVCATLIHALRSRDNGLTLSFFCGQHVGSNDDLQGPPGLMRSLVSSLILSLVQKGFITDLAPLRFSNPPPDFRHLSLSDVCRLFHCLLRLVPPDMPVYCFVDGVSYYEREIWRDEYDLMMDCFSNIIADKTPGIIFKLLLTSPTMSRWLPNLEPHQRVSLRNSRARGR